MHGMTSLVDKLANRSNFPVSTDDVKSTHPDLATGNYVCQIVH